MVCDRVVAGIFLGSWMAAAAEVVVKTLAWDCDSVLRAFEAGRVRSMAVAVCWRERQRRGEATRPWLARREAVDGFPSDELITTQKRRDD